MPVYLPIFRQYCLCVCVYAYASLYLFICLSVCLSVHPSIHPSIRLSVCLSACPSVRPPVLPSVRPPARPPVLPPVRLSVCLPVYLSLCVWSYRAVRSRAFRFPGFRIFLMDINGLLNEGPPHLKTCPCTGHHKDTKNVRAHRRVPIGGLSVLRVRRQYTPDRHSPGNEAGLSVGMT